MKNCPIISGSTANTYFKVTFSVVSILFIAMPIMRYISLNSNIMDLGIYSNTVINVLHNPQRAFLGHSQPILILYSLLFRFISVDFLPYVLLLSQSISIIISAYLLYKFYSKFLSLLFLLYFPVWNNVVLDFHPDVLVILISTLFFCFLKYNRIFFAFLSSLSLIVVKEPYCLQIIGCGLFILLSPSIFIKRYLKIFYGFLLILFGLFSYLFNTEVLIPYFSNGDVLGYSANYISRNNYLTYIFEFIKSVDLRNMINFLKIKYIILLLLPFLFISIFSPYYLIVGSPILLISILSTNQNYYNLYSHYTSGLIIPILISFNYGLKNLKNFSYFNIIISSKIRLFLPILIFSFCFFSLVIFGPSPFSRLFWSSKIDFINYHSYLYTERSYIIKNAVSSYIPSDRNITISSQNSVNIPGLYDRFNYVPFPLGFTKSYSMVDILPVSIDSLFSKYISKDYYLRSDNKEIADFVIIDLRKPIYYIDKGCNFVYSKCTDLDIYNSFHDDFKLLSKSYYLIFSYDSFYIFKRIQ